MHVLCVMYVMNVLHVMYVIYVLHVMYVMYVMQGEEEPQLELLCTHDAAASSFCFLIDHYWTFLTFEDGVKCLKSVPGLMDGVCTVSGVDSTGCEAKDVLERCMPQIGSYAVGSVDAAQVCVCVCVCDV